MEQLRKHTFVENMTVPFLYAFMGCFDGCANCCHSTDARCKNSITVKWRAIARRGGREGSKSKWIESHDD
jgi:hypothetical protein